MQETVGKILGRSDYTLDPGTLASIEIEFFEAFEPLAGFASFNTVFINVKHIKESFEGIKTPEERKLAEQIRLVSLVVHETTHVVLRKVGLCLCISIIESSWFLGRE